ncbi:MAG TPA: nucleoside triphosphate pyrophosphohydrolase [Spirochaetia bacterium]|nr:MAG: nucleoside triphosphate pyrophosphohydrolase [Spirochaetes bacterium GWB1_36_13]HCL55772.1 nucleoside triphosphate pyrophosphohydrolase [Spirochaetia bacterium]
MVSVKKQFEKNGRNMQEFDRLKEIVDVLRGEKGCDWDKKQTFSSMKKYVLEEVYELFEAVEDGNISEIEEELGDLAMHVVFLSRIAEEEKWFNIGSVLNKISDKLIERHPHVFQGLEVDGVDDILKNWEELKKKEKKEERKYYLDGIPRTLPSIAQAVKIQEKLSRIGFDWGDSTGVIEKLEEELEEMRVEIRKNDLVHFEKELGDVFFVLINLALKMGCDPDAALRSSNKKVVERFLYIEKKLEKEGRDVSKTEISVLENLWQEAKKNEI